MKSLLQSASKRADSSANVTINLDGKTVSIKGIILNATPSREILYLRFPATSGFYSLKGDSYEWTPEPVICESLEAVEHFTKEINLKAEVEMLKAKVAAFEAQAMLDLLEKKS